VKTTQTAGEPTPSGQLKIEIRAERAAAEQPVRVRVTSEFGFFVW